MDQVVGRVGKPRTCDVPQRRRVCSVLSCAWSRYLGSGYTFQPYGKEAPFPAFLLLDGEIKLAHLSPPRTHDTDCFDLCAIWVFGTTKPRQGRERSRSASRLAASCESMGVRVCYSPILRVLVSSRQSLGFVRRPFLWACYSVV